MPGRTGMIAGLFFGLAFGMGGLGAAVLGEIADLTSIGFVYKICAFLPLIGLVTWFLPNIESSRRRRTDLPPSADEARKANSAGLAQLVEHLICNQGVTGSSPVAGTIKIDDASRY